MAKTKAEIQRDYSKRTNYAAQKKYDENVVKITIKLHREKDADILACLDESKPTATQLKELIRKGLQQ